MTQPIDTERSHEFKPDDFGYCLFVGCALSADAAVHQVAKTANEPHEFQYANVSNGLCWCGKSANNPVHAPAEVHQIERRCMRCETRRDCDPDCEFCANLHKQNIDCVHGIEAEVHQTPEPQRCEFTCRDPSYGSTCKVAHRCKFPAGHQLSNSSRHGHYPSDFEGREPPPDQHVAPLRTMWVSREYATNPDHHMRLLGDDVEVVPIAPIQAALERCEASTKGYVDDGDGVTVRKSDWDALIEAVKRENVNGE